MTFEEKEERYVETNKLLNRSNYIAQDELEVIKNINIKCLERYEAEKKKGSRGQCLINLEK